RLAAPRAPVGHRRQAQPRARFRPYRCAELRTPWPRKSGTRPVCTSSSKDRRHGVKDAWQQDFGATLGSHLRFSIVSTCAHVWLAATGMTSAAAAVILGIKPLGA